jgi:hypothetical protein
MIQEGVSQIKVKTIVMFIIIYLFITFVKKKKNPKKAQSACSSGPGVVEWTSGLRRVFHGCMFDTSFVLCQCLRTWLNSHL